MEELFTPLLLLSLWRVQFATGQSFNCPDLNASRINPDDFFVEGAGRVEICYCFSVGGCQWVTIPVSANSVSWGWKNALVACREASPAADYGVISPILQYTLLSSIQAPSTQLVLPFYIVCDGSEDRVSECEFQPSSSYISHISDAYVHCRTTVPVEGSVRLVGLTPVNQLGIVEFYVSGRGWVTGCSDSWDLEDANLTCISLGYDSGLQYYYPAVAATSPIGVYNISCTGNEADITLCSYSTVGFCSDTTIRAGASCTRSGLEAGTIRLFPSQSDGFDQRVEILYDDRWGSVCDLGWDDKDGSVACSSLDYNKSIINSDPTFNTGNEVRPIWISFVDCSGSESSITECSTSSIIGYQPSCDHSNDAALACAKSGLSGGEIAGIVIGVLSALGLIGLCYCCHRQSKKKEVALQQRRLREADRATAARETAARVTAARVETNRVAAATVPSEPEAAATSTFGSTSTGDGANSSALPQVESNTELRKGAPPSYDEALLFIGAPVNNVPPTNTSESSAQPETSLPPYPVPDPVPTHPNTGNSNLPYPDASSPTAPYPTVGGPYPTTNIALAPYPPSRNAQAPYPQEPGPGNVQNYPPPTNPGYPPLTSPGHLPPTNPAYPLAAPVNYPLQPFTAPTYLPNQPVQDVGAPLPPVLELHEESNM